MLTTTNCGGVPSSALIPLHDFSLMCGSAVCRHVGMDGIYFTVSCNRMPAPPAPCHLLPSLRHYRQLQIFSRNIQHGMLTTTNCGGVPSSALIPLHDFSLMCGSAVCRHVGMDGIYFTVSCNRMPAPPAPCHLLPSLRHYRQLQIFSRNIQHVTQL